jgi:uncharacterized membrane protein HdeD (DUF308 family)
MAKPEKIARPGAVLRFIGWALLIWGVFALITDPTHNTVGAILFVAVGALLLVLGYIRGLSRR